MSVAKRFTATTEALATGPGHKCDNTRSNTRSAMTPFAQLTPSFFCKLDDEVVYWNSSFLSG